MELVARSNSKILLDVAIKERIIASQDLPKLKNRSDRTVNDKKGRANSNNVTINTSKITSTKKKWKNYFWFHLN